MSDTPPPVRPKPKSEPAATELPLTQRLQPEEPTAESVENQPLQSEKPATEPLQNTPITEQSESEQPAVKQAQKRLEKLLEQRKQIDEQIKAQQARAAQEKRKQENREKVLIGAAIQKQVRQGKLTEAWLLAVLDAELILEHDRKVFNLSTAPATKSAKK